MSKFVDFYLIGELVDSHGNVHYEDLKNLPAADVVPMEFHERCMELEIKKQANMVDVVRCKDCKYRKFVDFGMGDCLHPKGSKHIAFDNHYCSYGERRSDEQIH